MSPFNYLAITSSIALGMAVLLTSPATIAQVQAVKLKKPQQESLYYDLIDELRCLVCANQNLSDSNSDLAKDLRNKVHDMVRDGDSRDEIIDYMVARYGAYILYRPRFSPTTFFLWLAPFVVVLLGLGVVFVMSVGKSRRQPPRHSAQQINRTRKLLKDKGRGA